MTGSASPPVAALGIIGQVASRLLTIIFYRGIIELLLVLLPPENRRGLDVPLPGISSPSNSTGFA
jgi:hypothetical protein